MATVQLGQTEVILLQQLAEAYGVTGELGQTEVVLLQQILAAKLSGAGGGGASLPSQTGNAGKVLGTDGTDALWQAIPPALPVWTYTSGVIGAGLFNTDNALVESTTQITFSATDGSGSIPWTTTLSSLPVGTRLILTSSTGSTAVFQVESPTEIGASIQFTASPSAGSGSWSGEYQLSFVYAAQVTLDYLYALNDPPISGTSGEFSPITSMTVVNGIVTSVSS